MRSFFLLGLLASVVAAVSAASLPKEVPMDVKHLYPEDGVYDKTRNLFYRSNLWRGRITVYDPRNKSHFNVHVPGVSSNGNGEQQMAGVSISSYNNANRFFCVAKNKNDFNFGNQKPGPSSFHAFELPLKESSKPIFQVYFEDVQKQFKQQTGTRPFGPVDVTQDHDGNSYVAFALGIPAIAKISPDGKQVTAWASEKSNGSQRPGYTGLQFDPRSNRILALGGPRPLTVFDVTQKNPKPQPVQINGNFGTTDGTEKLTYVPVNGKSVMVAARAPYAIAFHSDDNWKSAWIKKTKNDQLKNIGFTAVVEYDVGRQKGLYASSAYFSEGANGDRSNFPLIGMDASILY